MVNANFNAQHVATIFVDALNGLIDLGKGEILQLANAGRERCQTRGREVYEGIDLSRARIENIRLQRLVIAQPVLPASTPVVTPEGRHAVSGSTAPGQPRWKKWP